MATITEKIHADFLARYGQPRTETIEAGRVRDYLLSKGAPARLSLDETDAFAVLNYMLFQRGSFCYAHVQDA